MEVLVWIFIAVVWLIVQGASKAANGKNKKQKTPLRGEDASKTALRGTSGVYVPKAPAAPAPAPTPMPAMPSEGDTDPFTRLFPELLVAQDTASASQEGKSLASYVESLETKVEQAFAKSMPADQGASDRKKGKKGKKEQRAAVQRQPVNPVSPFTQMKPQVETLVPVEAAPAEGAAGFHLRLEQSNLMDAIVLQEVLTRPMYRRRPGMPGRR